VRASSLAHSQRIDGASGFGRHVLRPDLLLAAAVVAICGLIIIPLHPVAIDSLIAANLALSVVLLIVSLYIPSAIALSSFPALLLFTTLFRLGLNISSTRQILLNAHAGHIIEAFGKIVVGGNLIVGAILFLIITIVQFLVVTKGAERVAEVGARFTLDALPGKQMSIDADLRAGVLDNESAKLRRRHLEQESQMHGAMDGAMKFVKGDAIAGLIITAINILGGVALGILQKGMPAAKALKVYSVLSVGDGLVSQIPALLIAITSGIIVTRVGAQEGASDLGNEIFRQFSSQPNGLLVGGALVLLFAAIPGMPPLPFIVLGSATCLLGYRSLSQQRRVQMDHGGGAFADKTAETSLLPPPILVQIHEELLPRLAPIAEIASYAERVVRALSIELGVPFPKPAVRVSDESAPEHLTIALYDVPTCSMRVPAHCALVSAEEAVLENAGVAFVRGGAFPDGQPCLWAEDRFRSRLRELNLGTLTAMDGLGLALQSSIRKSAGEFLGIQEVRHLLDHLELHSGALVKEVLRVANIGRITEVLRLLIREEISMRHLRQILEALLEWAPKEKDNHALAELTRVGLKRYISHKYATNHQVSAILLDPAVEDTLRKSLKQTGSGAVFSLPADYGRLFLQTLREQTDALKKQGLSPVLVVQIDLRRAVRRHVEGSLPGLAVVAFQELSQDIVIQPKATLLLN
jgi:type III secretion protein V